MRKIITHFKVVLTLLLPVTVSAQQIQWQSCMASQFNHWFGEENRLLTYYVVICLFH